MTPESNKWPDGLCILVHIRIVFGTNNVFLFHNFRYGTLANPIFPCKSFARRFLQTISFWKQFPTNTNQPIFSTYFLINILDNVKFCIQSQTRLGWHCWVEYKMEWKTWSEEWRNRTCLITNLPGELSWVDVTEVGSGWLNWVTFSSHAWTVGWPLSVPTHSMTVFVSSIDDRKCRFLYVPFGRCFCIMGISNPMYFWVWTCQKWTFRGEHCTYSTECPAQDMDQLYSYWGRIPNCYTDDHWGRSS